MNPSRAVGGGLVLCCFFATAVRAATLESSALRLQVSEAPYGFQLIERATGQVLVATNTTTFTVAGVPATVLSATDVAATATTVDANLLLSGGATAHVRFSFTTPEVLEVVLTSNGTRVQEQFADQQERYYGVWEYPWGGSLDNRGNDRAFLGVGSNTGSLYTSGRAPFYLTSRRYGVYAETVARGHYTIASAGKTGFWFDVPQLKYHLIYGPGYYQILARYAALAGGPVMPPLWALDSTYWADDFHRDLHNASNAQGNVVDLATQLQQRHIRASAILVDRPFGTGSNGWGNLDFDNQFPDPAGMVSALRARGLNLVLWVANRAWNDLYSEGSAAGYLFPNVSTTVGPAVDLRNAAAYAWFKGKLDPFVVLGARGYKIDRGEQSEQPDSVQNENVTLFARMSREGLVARHGEDVFVIARNVNDTGRRYAAVWNGDSNADFTGLRYSVLAALRSGAVMMPVWGSDTGGYLRGSGGPSEEVFARWYGFSAFSTVMEVLVGDGHTPWYDYSAALVAIAKKHGDAHHDLMPYTRSYVHAATSTGAPVMRPLVFSYPDDNATPDLADQYLFGAELLVAPVLQAGATSRAVHLPAGKWVDYNNRPTVVTGGTSVTAAAPLDTIPTFAREGAIIPRGDIHQGNDNWTPGWAPSLRIEVYPSATQASRFDYFTGATVRTITAAKANRTITISFDDLALPGTLEVYVAGFGSVVRNGITLSSADYGYSSAAQLLSVPFRGATTLELTTAVSIFGPGNDDLPDAGIDASPDVAAAVVDASADAAPDTAPDLAADVAVDVRPDGGVRDAGIDLAVDARADLVTDAGADVLADVLADVGPDLGSADAFTGGDRLANPLQLQQQSGCSCTVGAADSGADLSLLVLPLLLGWTLRRRRRW